MTVSIPNTKNALVAQLQARPGLAGVLVRRNKPGVLPAETDRVYVLGTRDHRFQPAEDPPRQETYRVAVRVESLNFLGDPATGESAAEDRLWALVTEIDAEVGDGPELNGAVWGSVLTVVAQDVNPTADGWLGWADCELFCRLEGR